MTTCYIQLPPDFDERYIAYKKLLTVVPTPTRVFQPEVATTEVQKITFDSNTGSIIFGAKICTIPISSNQFQLCKLLFDLPIGEWLNETDAISTFFKEGERSFYDAIRLINERVEKDLQIKKLLVYNASRVKIRMLDLSKDM